MQIIQKLGDFFNTELNDVVKVWIATALINDDGFNKLLNALPENVLQRYLIGIDLPTTVSVLRTMQSKLSADIFEAKLYKNGLNFHPKVYWFEYADGTMKAVVGSANLTSGGLQNNVELNVMVDDPAACTSIRDWFNGLYTDAYPLDDENIKRYEDRRQAFQHAGDALGKMQQVELQKPAVIIDGLSGIDFSDRYFKAEHHRAFRSELWNVDNKAARAERKAVADVFTELHDQIYPQFYQYGLQGLYPNVKQHLVSMYYHDPSKTKQGLNAMWLSYGKSEQEIKQYHKIYRQPYLRGDDPEDDKQSFINHARLQVRLEFKEIGIWILFAKNNGGGVVDRDAFLRRMRADPAYRRDFFELLTALPDQYFIKVNDERKEVVYFTDEDMLFHYCRKDHQNAYFIIGREYEITDPEMSEERLPVTVLEVFRLLYPLYRHMRHYIL